jgi:hypothetical protein
MKADVRTKPELPASVIALRIPPDSESWLYLAGIVHLRERIENQHAYRGVHPL